MACVDRGGTQDKARRLAGPIPVMDGAEENAIEEGHDRRTELWSKKRHHRGHHEGVQLPQKKKCVS